MTHKKPPQGTTSIVSEKAEALAEHGAEKLVNATLAGVLDADLQALQEALWDRNQKEAARLIPLLKARYGGDLYKLLKGR